MKRCSNGKAAPCVLESVCLKLPRRLLWWILSMLILRMLILLAVPVVMLEPSTGCAGFQRDGRCRR